MRFLIPILTVATLGCLRATAKEAAEEQVTVTITRDLALTDFLDRAAASLGRPVLYDPNAQRLRGQTMGVDMSWSVGKSEELGLYRAVLAFYEIVLVPAGPHGREILLALDSRSTNNFVKNKAQFVPHQELGRYADKDGLYIVTSLPVRHVENLTVLRVALSTLVSPAGIGRVHEVPGAKRILVMDFAPTVAAMAQLVHEMDADLEPRTVTILHLAHVPAESCARTLKDLFEAEPQKAPPQAAAPSPGPRIAAHVESNAVVVVATEAELARIREVVEKLDVARKE